MKLIIYQNFIKYIFVVFLFVLSLNCFAQATFKVVCDKTDKTVKVVKTENRSPNYIPIKGGFPFRQIAQQWIDDNYSTTTCNPGEIVKEIKEKEKSATPSSGNSITNSTQTPNPNTNTKLKARRNGPNSANQFRNTSFIANARFTNLGEAFRLESKLMPGFELGIEQLFGGTIYFGTGINVDFYFSDFDGIYDIDTETIYFFKFPAFVGYRSITKKITTCYEAGVAVNTNLIGTELSLESFGQSAKSSSFDFMARMKVGSEKVMLALGTDIWFTDVFENNSYKMTSVFVGLVFNF